MISNRPFQITEQHLRRKAVIYIRQSSLEQVRENTGSAAVQLDQRLLLNEWGWPDSAVSILDEDLGRSGAIPGFRSGFDRLVKDMRADSIGIVAVVDHSRISRNQLDHAVFAETAKAHDVLIVAGRTVVDFRDPNSEFLGTLLGSIAIRENRVRAEFGRRARRKKAEAGIATTPRPLGYVRGPDRSWLKDSDIGVRDTIQLVFDKFLELGSAGAVLRWALRKGVQLPARHGRWQTASLAVILRILRNEAYAGSYLYGRTALDHARPPMPSGHRRKIRRPDHEVVRIPDHHEPYVSYPVWLEIQHRLGSNRNVARPFAGRGEALLQGLIVCTKHNIPIRTVYNDHPSGMDRATGKRPATYRCDPATGPLPLAGGCSQAKAAVIDGLIEPQIFRVLAAPSSAELAELAKEAQRGHDALQRTRQQEMLRADQAVAAAERAFEGVDIGHRRVRQRLSEKLEQALHQREELKAKNDRHPLIAAYSLGTVEIAELRALVQDLPTLWRHPAVSAQQRKMLVRAIVQTIRMTPTPGAWSLEVEWVGGARTRVQLLTSKGVKELVITAYRDGASFAEIAELLAQRGGLVRQGPQPRGMGYSEKTVRRLLSGMGVYREIEETVAPFIVKRFPEATARMIAAELNTAGVRHWNSPWTGQRVWGAISRIRKGAYAGVSLPPAQDPIEASVRRLHDAGLYPKEIAAQLAAAGSRNKKRGLVRHNLILRTLYALHLEPNSVRDARRVAELLAEWSRAEVAVPEVTRRLCDLGLRTMRGDRWSDQGVRYKLARLGLPFPGMAALRRGRPRRLSID